MTDKSEFVNRRCCQAIIEQAKKYVPTDDKIKENSIEINDSTDAEYHIALAIIQREHTLTIRWTELEEQIPKED